MRLLMNSYGNTWHTWHTGWKDGKGEPGHPFPMGDAQLMWSFNRDGEVDDDLGREFNAAMDIDEAGKRDARREFIAHAHPQHGVNALREHFPDSTPVEGVRDVEDER